jgi:hypothetical protein
MQPLLYQEAILSMLQSIVSLIILLVDVSWPIKAVLAECSSTILHLLASQFAQLELSPIQLPFGVLMPAMVFIFQIQPSTDVLLSVRLVFSPI